MYSRAILCVAAIFSTACSQALDRSEAATLLAMQDGLFRTYFVTLTIGNNPFAVNPQVGSRSANDLNAIIRMGLLTQELIASEGDTITEELKQKLNFERITLQRSDFSTLTWQYDDDIYKNSVNMNKATPFISKTSRSNGNLFISGRPRQGQVAPHIHSYSYDAFELQLPEYTSFLKEVIGIRELDGGNSQCDAIVEYVVEYKLEEFGIVRGQRAREDRVQEACFAQYDDGWRIMNPNI